MKAIFTVHFLLRHGNTLHTFYMWPRVSSILSSRNARIVSIPSMKRILALCCQTVGCHFTVGAGLCSQSVILWARAPRHNGIDWLLVQPCVGQRHRVTGQSSMRELHSHKGNHRVTGQSSIRELHSHKRNHTLLDLTFYSNPPLFRQRVIIVIMIAYVSSFMLLDFRQYTFSV